ncbi:DUF1643 domain-containing protein [Thalassorhabdus alkalitolerans]|uniref:DUF1643 domain-containing protein n=1 Tax=Thalassorhabdus alkalitolerans TaxID=2282697 RepID=A0ABW0YUB1_9BACI
MHRYSSTFISDVTYESEVFHDIPCRFSLTVAFNRPKGRHLSLILSNPFTYEEDRGDPALKQLENLAVNHLHDVSSMTIISLLPFCGDSEEVKIHTQESMHRSTYETIIKRNQSTIKKAAALSDGLVTAWGPPPYNVKRDLVGRLYQKEKRWLLKFLKAEDKPLFVLDKNEEQPLTKGSHPREPHRGNSCVGLIPSLIISSTRVGIAEA